MTRWKHTYKGLAKSSCLLLEGKDQQLNPGQAHGYGLSMWSQHDTLPNRDGSEARQQPRSHRAAISRHIVSPTRPKDLVAAGLDVGDRGDAAAMWGSEVETDPAHHDVGNV